MWRNLAAADRFGCDTRGANVLELVVVVWLCWRNGRTARRRGRSRLPDWLITLGLLFGGDLAGATVGTMVIGGPHAPIWAEDAFAWAGLILGGAASYLIANRATRAPAVVVSAPWEPTHWAPQGGLEVSDAWDWKEPVVGVILGRSLVQVDERVGDRARVTTADGSQGWVDGGGLVAFDSHRDTVQ
jgi:hypothetical protein